MLTEPLGQTRSKGGTLHIHSITVLPIDLLNEKKIKESVTFQQPGRRYNGDRQYA